MDELTERTQGQMLLDEMRANKELRAEVERLRDVLKDLAEGDCAYGDNCPTFGSRHGQCYVCKARAPLEGK